MSVDRPYDDSFALGPLPGSVSDSASGSEQTRDALLTDPTNSYAPPQAVGSEPPIPMPPPAAPRGPYVPAEPEPVAYPPPAPPTPAPYGPDPRGGDRPPPRPRRNRKKYIALGILAWVLFGNGTHVVSGWLGREDSGAVSSGVSAPSLPAQEAIDSPSLSGTEASTWPDGYPTTEALGMIIRSEATLPPASVTFRVSTSGSQEYVLSQDGIETERFTADGNVVKEVPVTPGARVSLTYVGPPRSCLITAGPPSDASTPLATNRGQATLGCDFRWSDYTFR